ncbi:MAG: hypothetical protein PHO53_05475 [Actinomycetota bacterium]|nr:hypothetical protein [Actinomycetota bacterium]
MDTPSKKISKLGRVPPEVWIFAFYFGVAVLVTWPLVCNLQNSMFGTPCDNMGVSWAWWWRTNASSFGGTPSFCPIIGYPFGTYFQKFSMAPLLEYPALLLTRLFGEIVAVNIFIFSSFFLSGITMYFLARHITSGRFPAALAGFAYMCCPYIVLNNSMELSLGTIQWIPLYILALLSFLENPNAKRSALLAGSALLVAWTNLHYALFIAIFSVAFLAGRLIHKKIRLKGNPMEETNALSSPHEREKKLLASLAVIACFLFGTIAIYLLGTSSSFPKKFPVRESILTERGEAAVASNSAKPSNYVLPRDDNCLAARIIQEMRKKNTLYFDVRSGAYLGWSRILLGAYALVCIHKQRRKKKEETLETESRSNLEGKSDIAWGLTTAAIICFLFSLSPYYYIGSAKIYTPSWLFTITVPDLRAIYRLSIMVIISTLLLASLGLSELLKRLKGKTKQCVLSLVVVAFALESLLLPPFKNFDFGKLPEVYERISELPSHSACVFYPIFEPGYFSSERYLFYQREFEKPLLNHQGLEPFGYSDAEAFTRTVYNPFNPQTPSILKSLGIDYAVYFGKLFELNSGTGKAEKEIRHMPVGFELVEKFESKDEFGDAYLFKITAGKAEVIPVFGGDVSAPYVDEGRVTVRLMENKAKLWLVNQTQKTVRTRVEIPIANNPFDQKIEIKDGKKILWKGVLKGKESINIILPEVLVSPKGKTLELSVKGKKTQVALEQQLLFGGIYQATISLGDVKVETY